jgi:hypothetical protein
MSELTILASTRATAAEHPRGHEAIVQTVQPYRWLRIGIITGLFERKSEYQISSVACLFYERVEPYD